VLHVWMMVPRPHREDRYATCANGSVSGSPHIFSTSSNDYLATCADGVSLITSRPLHYMCERHCLLTTSQIPDIVRGLSRYTEMVIASTTSRRLLQYICERWGLWAITHILDLYRRAIWLQVPTETPVNQLHTLELVE